MSTAETTVVVGLTVAQAVEKYGEPKAGHKFAVRGGFVVFDSTGQPVQVARKKRSKGGGKKKGSDYPIPAGGLRNHETPDFSVGKHRKLKIDAFKSCDDPELSHARWDVWYHEQLLSRARQELKTIESAGSPEERKAARENQSVMVKMLELAKSNPAMAQQMMELLAKSTIG